MNRWIAWSGLLALAGCAGPLGDGKPLPPAYVPVRCWALTDAADVEPDSAEPPATSLWDPAERVIRLKGAAGETLGFQFILSAEPDTTTEVQVAFTDLAGRTTNIPASAITPLRAAWVKVERFRPWYPAETGRPPKPRLFLDPLIDMPASFTVAPPRHEALFVDLDIPHDAAPGDYTGTLSVSSKGSAPIEVPIRLEVWPFVLPRGPSSLPAVARVSLSSWMRWEGDYTGRLPPPPDFLIGSSADAAVRFRERFPALLELLRRHGVRTMIPDLRPRVDFQWPGRAIVDWSAYDEFLKTYLPVTPGRPLEPLAAPLGADHPDARLFVAPRESGAEIGDSATATAFHDRSLRDYARQVARHLGELGRLSSTVVLYDEPPAGSAPALEAARAARFAGTLAELSPALTVALPFSPRWLDHHLGAKPSHTRDVLASATGIRSPSAAWYEPPKPGVKGTPQWLAVSEPPFLPGRRVETPRAGIVAWGWAAFRYRPDALDIGSINLWPAPDAATRAAWRTGAGEPPAIETLVGSDGEVPWVYPDAPRGSIRLKLLRRAIQDHQYLQILAHVIGSEPASRLTRALLRFAVSEAGTPQGRFGGWSNDADDYDRVRRVMARAVTGSLRRGAPTPETAADRDAMDRLVASSERIELEVAGVRLVGDGPAGSARLDVRVRLANVGALARRDLGSLSLEVPGTDRPTEHEPGELAAGGVAETVLSAPTTTEIVSNEATLVWRRAGEQRRIPLRLCRQTVRAVSIPPVIDGKAGDWNAGSDQQAGDFVGSLSLRSKDDRREPAPLSRRTTVSVCADDRFLYFGIECDRKPGDRIETMPGNRPLREGSLLWGEDAFELVLSPEGSGRFNRLAVKPNGAVETASGPADAFPSEPWAAEATAVCSPSADTDRPWFVELRIPWTAFGGRPKPGAMWGVNYARHIGAAGETGSWSYSPNHIFQSGTLGTLVFP